MKDIVKELEGMSTDELRTLAKKINLTGYSSLRKADLIFFIVDSGGSALRRRLFPTWWQKHNQHVYGISTIIGLLLAVDVCMRPLTSDNRTIESPIALVEYAELPPSDKTTLFRERVGQQFVWQGFLSKTNGFELDTLTGVPFETPIGAEITPTQSQSPQLVVEIQFEELLPSDSGYKHALQLNGLIVGQRIRLSGQLGGAPEKPILREAFLDAVFPIGE